MSDSRLSETAYEVADRYRAGEFPQLKHASWSDTWAALIGELRRRCPGHSETEYAAALESGFVDSR